jgi:heme/copper-type cytochrome/quinol oxidase subunit 4
LALCRSGLDVRSAACVSFEFDPLKKLREAGATSMNTAEAQNSGAKKDLVVYVCLLALAGIQFFIAYQDISVSQMFVRMLVVAIVEGALALLFFMHLWENRGLKWFVVIFTVAVILGMQYGWTDSFRLIDGAPWAK